ncbi:hypothetical protein EW145_g4442 [Phellinidium pouzarii]|uniref:Uncharacterized protein n=1 Tax=Phellinidium pouzarii TaxID=167371 RepID=A0A4S4L4X5_9AGAM|nr:hypothetical protein EW145_g4442 [Phellinidium pouzarii]
MASTGTLRGGALIRKQPSYYTAEQACQYLERVGYVEAAYTAQDITEGRFPADLENMAVLVRRHLLSFCNESTPMHYSAEHYLDVSPEATFKRLVVDRLGGTYCYGHHYLILGVFRALGYRAYSGIARMNHGFFGNGPPAYAAYGHMMLFVQLGEGYGTDPAHTWVVDVAPGPPAPMLPMPLSADPQNIVRGASPGEVNRLTRGFSPQSSLVLPDAPGSPYSPNQAARVVDEHALWQVEYCGGAGSPTPEFKPVYQFMEQEFSLLDYAVQHYTKMYKPFEDIFWDDIVCARYVLADEHEEGAERRKITERTLAKLGLFRGVVKKRIGFRELERVVLKSESERVVALKKYFDVNIEEKDIVHIEGRASSLASLAKKTALSAGLETAF